MQDHTFRLNESIVNTLYVFRAQLMGLTVPTLHMVPKARPK
jgi:hypothetical protein